MSLSFPVSPSLNQIYQQEDASYIWSGVKWERIDSFQRKVVTEYTDIVEQTSSTVSIEPDKYNYFKITIDANTTITVPSASPYSSFVIELSLGTTAYTITWSDNVEWAGGSAPSYNYGYTAKILLEFTTYDGVNWVASELLDYTVVPDYSFQGSVSGYTSGGDTLTNIIDKFPFSSDGNATDVGDLSLVRRSVAGQSSSTNGYTSGGASPGTPAGLYTNLIDKFPFAVDGNASDVGDLTQGRQGVSGQSSSISGYTTGGYVSGGGRSNVIDKFPFSSDSNATDVGDLTLSRSGLTGQSSTESGYSSGGYVPSVPPSNIVDKFPFASDGNATDVGDLTAARFKSAGQSSTVSGYTSGGSTIFNTIDRFPFAADANATDVGDLTQARRASSGQSSTAFGYTSGGAPGPVSTIDKFPFSSDANATDVGDLTQGRESAAGQQV